MGGRNPRSKEKAEDCTPKKWLEVSFPSQGKVINFCSQGKVLNFPSSHKNSSCSNSSFHGKKRPFRGRKGIAILKFQRQIIPQRVNFPFEGQLAQFCLDEQFRLKCSGKLFDPHPFARKTPPYCKLSRPNVDLSVLQFGILC